MNMQNEIESGRYNAFENILVPIQPLTTYMRLRKLQLFAIRFGLYESLKWALSAVYFEENYAERFGIDPEMVPDAYVLNPTTYNQESTNRNPITDFYTKYLGHVTQTEWTLIATAGAVISFALIREIMRRRRMQRFQRSK
ncbi:MAG: hypothetical protein Fur003_3260 [Candidatus Dojkabacteria bacterium]